MSKHSRHGARPAAGVSPELPEGGPLGDDGLVAPDSAGREEAAEAVTEALMAFAVQAHHPA
jgi:hypothetical protein